MHAAGKRVRVSPTSPAARLSAGSRLAALLGWMAGQPFSTVVDSGLLRDVEEIVVAAYLTEHPGTSRPDAYRWLRYEDPAPVERLVEGARKLAGRSAQFSEVAVDKACAKASKLGYLN